MGGIPLLVFFQHFLFDFLKLVRALLSLDDEIGFAPDIVRHVALVELAVQVDPIDVELRGGEPEQPVYNSIQIRGRLHREANDRDRRVRADESQRGELPRVGVVAPGLRPQDPHGNLTVFVLAEPRPRRHVDGDFHCVPEVVVRLFEQLDHRLVRR